MSLITIEANKPLFTLITTFRIGVETVKEIVQYQKRPILCTDQDAVIEYATTMVRKFPCATYTVARVNSQMEM